ncbi:MAG TPA: nodulation protein NfeD [Patescibacteria group bacterium]|nr:nodulation protein NfeD [Patescibacteria group bacterium]
MRATTLGIAAVCVLLLAAAPVPDPRATPTDAAVLVADLRGPITSVTVEYVDRALARARQGDFALAVFEMDTPGGLVSSTESIIQSILSSKVPVVVYVSPSGAQAASAGLYISNAADLIAMAPGTRIGAGHPVSLFGGSPGGESKGGRDYMGEKIENDMAAGVRSIATNRGRNAAVYEKMVRESISLTETEAIDQKVIDLVTKDLDDLLRALDGREVTRFDGTRVKLALANARTTRYELTARQRILSWIASPEVSMILFGIAVLGLFVEFNNPGLIAPGVVGGLALILWAMSLQILPINLLGLLLIALAVSLFVLEIKITSHGLLTVAGAATLTLGFVTLFDTDRMPDLGLSLRFILPTTLTLTAVMAIVTTVAVRAQRGRVLMGVESLPGEIGEAMTDIGSQGKVFVHGEYWDATSTEPIAMGRRVRIRSVRNMAVEVEPEDR